MQPLDLFRAIDRLLEAADILGPDPQVDAMVREMRIVRADLSWILDEIENADEFEVRKRALARWAEMSQWAELLVTTLSEKLKVPIPA